MSASLPKLGIPPHVHIARTAEGASALGSLPQSLRHLPSRKQFPVAPVIRPMWERIQTIKENLESRARGSLERFGANTRADLLKLSWLGVTRAISYRDYIILGMNSGRHFSLPAGYVCFWKRHRVREFVNCPECEQFIHNKVLAKRYFANCGIAQCAPIAVIHNGRSYEVEKMTPLGTISDVARRLVGKTFIVKGIAGRYGTENTVCAFPQPDWKDCEAFILAALGKIEGATALIEELIVGDLTPYKMVDALNTLRLTTWINGEGHIVVIGAAQRLAVRPHEVDNWTSGGLAANVDIPSGLVTGPYYSKHLRPEPDHILPSPFVVPRWDAIKALVLKAHAKLPGLRSIGWDVANTEHGPLIVEGNHDWDIYIHQRLTMEGFQFDRQDRMPDERAGA